MKDAVCARTILILFAGYKKFGFVRFSANLKITGFYVVHCIIFLSSDTIQKWNN